MKKIFITLLSSLVLLACNQSTQTDAAKDSAATSNTEQRSTFKAANIREQMMYNRAVEAAIWGMPAANYQLMFAQMAKLNGKYNQVVWWPGLLDWKNQTLTPNPDVIYLMPFFNTKDVGPVVLEIPRADSGVFNGSIMNYWQGAIEDVGPGGVDKGKGGKYLILPPGYDKSKVPAGYIPMHAQTYHTYALLRSVLKSGSAADVATAVAYSKRIKVYPLSQAANPPTTNFVDASNVIFDSSIPYDMNFYYALDSMVQSEPWLERDKAMIDPLKTIGIERGKPFNPDARTQEILNASLKDAREWLVLNYESLIPFYEGKHWFFPITEEHHQSVIHDFEVPDSYPIDNRGTAYSLAFFSAKHLGESQYYLMCIKDNEGKTLEGKISYHLRVPANAPVTQYWSMTVYNRETHTFIRNAKWVGRSSQTPGLQKNSDGSVDIYFGPTAPPIGESNWVPTDANGEFEVLARFYGPKKELYDKTWSLGDIEKVK
jgi:hypothetical protein